MDYVAATSRTSRLAREAALTPEERVALAFELGRRDLVRFAEAHGLSLREAHRQLRANRQAGRTPSRVMAEGDG